MLGFKNVCTLKCMYILKLEHNKKCEIYRKFMKSEQTIQKHNFTS